MMSMKWLRVFLVVWLIAGGISICLAAPTPEPVKAMAGPVQAAPGPQAPPDQPPEIPPWGAGLSVLSPGLPVAVKVVYQPDEWGFQLEANFFYYLAMLRVDARRVLKGSRGTDIYGFVGVTASHIDDGLGTGTSVNNTLMGDVGVGGEIHFGKYRRFGVGIEGGAPHPLLQQSGARTV